MVINVSGQQADRITVTFEGRELSVRAGLSIAAALMEAGITHFRETPVTRSPRAPFCMMGACFDCLVIVDGKANCQACMIEACDGMAIRRQPGDGHVPTGGIDGP